MNEEQRELRDTVRAYLQKRDRKPDWHRMTGELGLTAIVVPEEHGGFGASLVELGIVLEEAGAALVSDPLLSTATAAAALDPALPASVELLPALAAGELKAALAIQDDVSAEPAGDTYLLRGVQDHVLDGDVADVCIVAAATGLFVVRNGEPEPLPTLDQTRGQSRLRLDGAPAELVGDGPGAAGRARDLLHAALASESVGVARAALTSTVDYLRHREQFGVPLATFQALRHRVADLAVRLDQATATARYAMTVGGTEEFAVVAPLAKLVAADVAYEVTAAAIQLHGGIGFTWEHGAHRYFKRATANRLLAGDPVSLRRMIGVRAGIAEAHQSSTTVHAVGRAASENRGS
jgi:alkylation response protein AidB-like acyl-CoA dehydrogenase